MLFSKTASIDSDISMLLSLVLMKQKQEKALQTVNHKQRSLSTRVNYSAEFHAEEVIAKLSKMIKMNKDFHAFKKSREPIPNH